MIKTYCSKSLKVVKKLNSYLIFKGAFLTFVLNELKF